MLSVTVLTLWVAPPEMYAIGIGFNGAESNCRIAHILGILLMNSCNTDIFFSNYYHLQSVCFEMSLIPSGNTTSTSTSIEKRPVLSSQGGVATECRESSFMKSSSFPAVGPFSGAAFMEDSLT